MPTNGVDSRGQIHGISVENVRVDCTISPDIVSRINVRIPEEVGKVRLETKKTVPVPWVRIRVVRTGIPQIRETIAITQMEIRSSRGKNNVIVNGLKVEGTINITT